MKIGVGPYSRSGSDGTHVHIDQPLSQEQTDLLLAILERASLTPRDVYAVEWEAESPIAVDYYVRHPGTGRIEVSSFSGEPMRLRKVLD